MFRIIYLRLSRQTETDSDKKYIPNYTDRTTTVAKCIINDTNLAYVPEIKEEKLKVQLIHSIDRKTCVECKKAITDIEKNCIYTPNCINKHVFHQSCFNKRYNNCLKCPICQFTNKDRGFETNNSKISDNSDNILNSQYGNNSVSTDNSPQLHKSISNDFSKSRFDLKRSVQSQQQLATNGISIKIDESKANECVEGINGSNSVFNSTTINALLSNKAKKYSDEGKTLSPYISCQISKFNLPIRNKEEVSDKQSTSDKKSTKDSNEVSDEQKNSKCNEINVKCVNEIGSISIRFDSEKLDDLPAESQNISNLDEFEHHSEDRPRCKNNDFCLENDLSTNNLEKN